MTQVLEVAQYIYIVESIEALHFVVEYSRLASTSWGDQMFLDYCQDILANIVQFLLNLKKI